MAVNLNVPVLLLLLFTNVFCDVPEVEYSKLPSLFELEDPTECSRNNGIFCKISVILTPYNGTNNSDTWKTIQLTNQDYRYFRHDKLLHGRCFKKNQMKKLENILKEDYASKYRKYSLEGNVENFSCFENDRFILNDFDYWDLFFISLGVIYVMFMFFSTAYTRFVHHEKDNPIGKVLSIFSVITIWEELRKPIKNEDFQNLKSIQGIRTLTMMLIISLHAFYGNMFSFLRNPEYVENIYMNLITRSMVTIFTFLVQTFFLISAWLLTVQINNIIKRNGDLTFKDIFLLGFNRYFRLIPVATASVLMLRSNAVYDVLSYINEDFIKRETDICRYYWWKNFFFLQNIYEPDKICSGVTWYLATDYQLYLFTLGLLYVSHKMKINRNYLIGFVVITTIVTQVAIIANTDFQGFLRLVPKTSNLVSMLASREFTMSYIPVWCNMNTYMIGVIFGTIYSKHKHEKLFNDYVKKIMWHLGFLGLPILAVFVTSFQYETRFFEMIISIFARPLFATGMGIGILGMATKTGGLIKIICESEPLVFLANFCYCVYIFHYALVFARIMRIEEPVEMSIFYIAKYTLIDYNFSFMIGALVYIVIEHPFLQLQKMILPQVTTKKKSLEEQTKQPIVSNGNCS